MSVEWERLARHADEAYRAGRMEEASLLYLRLLPLVHGKGEVEVLSLYRLGEIAFRDGRLDEALTRFSACRERALDGGEADGVFDSTARLATVHLALGSWSVAIALGRELLALGRRFDRRDAVAAALGIVGQASRRAGDLDDALEAAMEGYAVAQEAGNVAEQLAFIGDLALISLRRNEVDQAIAQARRGLELARLAGHGPSRLVFIGQLSQAHRGKGELDAARRMAEEGLRLASEADDDREIGAFRQDLAALYEMEGRLGEALREYETALRFFEKAGRSEALLGVHRNVAFLRARTGATREAFGDMLKALAIARSMDQILFNRVFSSLFDLVAIAWHGRAFEELEDGLLLVDGLLADHPSEGEARRLFVALRDAVAVLVGMARSRGEARERDLAELLGRADRVDAVLGTKLRAFVERGYAVLRDDG